MGLYLTLAERDLHLKQALQIIGLQAALVSISTWKCHVLENAREG